MVLERKVPPPPPSGKKSTKVSNTFLDFKTQRFLTFFCHIFTFTKTTHQPLPGTPTISLRPLGLVRVSRVKRLVKSFGMVNATADFGEHPQVINGYSELMAEVFGPENGVGTRSAIGMGSLPGNIAVEIEAVFEVAD